MEEEEDEDGGRLRSGRREWWNEWGAVWMRRPEWSLDAATYSVDSLQVTIWLFCPEQQQKQPPNFEKEIAQTHNNDKLKLAGLATR